MALHSTLSSIARVAVLSSVLSVVLALSACGSASSSKTSTHTSAAPAPLKIAIIGGTTPNDPTWAAIKAGAEKAAAASDVHISYTTPAADTSDAISQAITTAIATQPDGVILSLANCSAATASLQQAILVNIPIIAVNSGSTCATQLGALAYIGEVDYQAGLAAGARLMAEGAKHVICVTPDATTTTYQDRCNGVGDALKKAHDQFSAAVINPSNASAGEAKLQMLLNGDPTINGLITADTQTAAIAIPPVQQLIRTGNFVFASFDLSASVLQAVQQGTMTFAVDQEPYLQGYLAVLWISLYKRNLDTVVSPVIATGPAFVTSQNAAQIAQLVGTGNH